MYTERGRCKHSYNDTHTANKVTYNLSKYMGVICINMHAMIPTLKIQ